MEFDFHAPTKILFGRNKVSQLGGEIEKYTKRILLVYGSGSIKRSGLYDTITAVLLKKGILFKETAGVKANPSIDSVRAGAQLCKEYNLQLVLGVGGGSVIDCAKAIAAGACYEGDPWDFFTGRASICDALPVGAVLTLAATGSEVNGDSVISNEATRQKIGIGHPFLIPRFSVLDPCLTFSVPPHQTAAGTADIMSHVFEQYFSHTPAFLQDRLAEGVLKTCIKMGPVAMAEPDNYEARANLMWASSIALNGLLGTGKEEDWATHFIEHQLSAFYDMTHGLGLAILTPVWMEYVLDDKTLPKFCEYARNVWGLAGEDGYDLARRSIGKTREFFNSLGLASRLSEAGVEEKDLACMAGVATMGNSLGSFRELSTEDVINILALAF